MVRVALLLAATFALFSGAVIVADSRTFALSEIKQPDTPPAASDAPADDSIRKEPLPPVEGVPQPDSMRITPPPASEEPATADPQDEAAPDEGAPDDEAAPDDSDTDIDGGDTVARPEFDPDAPPPPVLYDIEQLPEPVKRMRQLIIDATKSGDVENLRPLIGMGGSATQLALGGLDGDPIDFLKSISGDPEGVEILAILQDVISAGYVHLDAGKPEELYVWPYFFAIPLEDLTAPQKVELFKIVTAGDYEDMKSYGAYIFYRVGITPDGRWQFFVAGD